MTDPLVIGYEPARRKLTWPAAVAALRQGHQRPRAEIADLFLGPPHATLLNRAAWIDGFGYGVKAVTVTRDNAARGLPTTQGAMLLFEADGGTPRAIIDSRLVTEVKTVSDSLLGAQLLARPDSRRLLVVGAGLIAASVVEAFAEMFPGLEEIAVWARRPAQAEELAARADVAVPVVVTADLAEAAARADIISSATLAREPVLKGEWVAPGTHVDLIGAFKADMREADDALISGGSLYVDSRDTTLRHIGELCIPLASGVISEADVKGDFYDLLADDGPARASDAEITVFKNGGGAHLDLMIADYIARAVAAPP